MRVRPGFFIQTLSFSLLCFVLSCSKGGTTSSGTYSCNDTAASQCFDLVGSATQETSACSLPGSVYSTSAACATANRAGSCTQGSGASEIVYHFYTNGGTPYTTSSAESTCSTLGLSATWVPNN